MLSVVDYALAFVGIAPLLVKIKESSTRGYGRYWNAE